MLFADQGRLRVSTLSAVRAPGTATTGWTASPPRSYSPCSAA